MMVSKLNRAAAAVCGYECAALFSNGRIPTVSALCEKYPWLSLVAVTALVVHLLPATAEARLASYASRRTPRQIPDRVA
jgi:hypothetical protein